MVILMRPPCELITRYVLPAIRSLIAKELIEKHGFSQVAAAKKLGITQAAISQYLYSKRGKKCLDKVGSFDEIRQLTEKIADGIAEDAMSDMEIMDQLCNICLSMRSRRLLCAIHKDLSELPDGCNFCMDT